MPYHLTPNTLTAPLITLILIVTIGMFLNFSMFLYSVFRRNAAWFNIGLDYTDKIKKITLNRAVRLEFIFFICQFARCLHTFYEVHSPYSWYRTDWPSVFERGFVTLALVVASVWDLIDQNRIRRHFEEMK